MLKRVKFITIPVTDQSRALEFYTKKVGLNVFTDQTMGGTRWIELQIPSGENVCLSMPANTHRCGHSAHLRANKNNGSAWEPLNSNPAVPTE